MRSRRSIPSINEHVAALVSILIVIFLGPTPSRAAESYRVSGVTVDIVADDAVAARSQAIDRAQRQGLLELMQRLSGFAAPDALPGVEGVAIERYVRSFEIAGERVAPDRYVGTLNITYQPGPVEALLAGAGIIADASTSAPMVLVPALREDEELRLWPEDSRWMEALATAADGGSRVDLVIPLGDLADIRALSGDNLAAIDGAALQAMAERYGASEIVVAVLVLQSTEAEPEAAAAAAAASEVPDPARVEIRPLLASELPAGTVTVEVPEAGPSEEPWLSAAYLAVERLDRLWIGQQGLAYADIDTIDVQVSLSGLQDWVRTHAALSSAEPVRDLRIEAFSRDRAAVSLTVAGGVDRLAAAMREHGLELTSEGRQWRLHRATPGIAPRAY